MFNKGRDVRMDDQVVIVTGGGRGIGQAICRRFAEEGAQVVAAARSEDQLDRTKEIIEQDGGLCAAIAVDVSSTDQLEHLINSTTRRFGRIDVLINNAGISACGPVKDLTSVDFETMMRVNVAAVFYACKLVWPIMQQQGSGVILNISSMAARDPFSGLGTYGATKAWVTTFTRGLADEGREFGIRAFAIGPSAVWTEMLRENCPGVPEHNALDPRHVADVAYALCQPAMTYAAGQTFYVRK